jgi:hypothetical protein
LSIKSAPRLRVQLSHGYETTLGILERDIPDGAVLSSFLQVGRVGRDEDARE